ncbi:MAG: Multidrug export protein EmrB [Alphaproteobacteria bacterium MarineAlpha9_Bin4]|nr:hypothetical protein [Pelagibacterales bacterium]PPR25740.1 MAG: Multidrug export protein EmrB [Alphaproteobacteria bacterium MarineAlpha9_Bin4]
MFKKKLTIFLIILAGFILNVLSVQIVGSSFKYLQGSLNASIDQISYIMSASLIAEVIIIPFTGWLARLISTRVLFLISLGGFLLASLGCAFSNNFFFMVLFRGLQGFFGGAMLPLMTASIYTLFKKNEIPMILSIAATFGVSSIALGPVLGGFLTEYLNWRWMFLYNIPIGVVVLILAYFFIDLKDAEKKLLENVDYKGIFFLAASLISFLLFIEEGERRDWLSSNFIIITLGLSIISFYLFINSEVKTKYPVVDLNIFFIRNFFIGCINVLVFSVTLYVPIFLLPIFLGEIRLMEPTDIGIIISTLGIAWMISGPFVGYLLKFIGARVVVIIGCFFIGSGALLQTQITSEYMFNELFFSQLLKGFGAQFLWIGNQYICLASIDQKKVKNASSMFNLILRLGAAIFIALSSNTLVKWQKIFYSEISNTYNSSFFYYKNEDYNMENMYSLLSEREGLIMALNNITFISMWTVLIPILLMFYVKTDNKKELLY